MGYSPPDTALGVAAADPDAPLDEVRLGRIAPPRGRRVEHDDLAPTRIAEVVDQLVDENPVVDVERVLHRLRRDVERLQHEGPDENRDHDGHTEQDGKLAPERAATPRRLVNHGGSLRRRARRRSLERAGTTKEARIGTATMAAGSFRTA